MRVLIVEDETVVSLLIEEMVEQLGHTVVGPATNVTGALMLVSYCDAALLDINLDGEDCFPVADALQEHGTPFLFSSGYDTVIEKYDHIPCLVKPFNVEMLDQYLCECTKPLMKIA